MRFGKAPHRASRTWWGVYLFAMVVLASYLFFDLLDVDGSQMRWWPGGDVILVAQEQSTAERLVRVDLSTPGSTYLIYPGLSWSSATEITRNSPVPTVLRIRQSRLLPRRNLHRELARVNASPADPAVPA